MCNIITGGNVIIIITIVLVVKSEPKGIGVSLSDLDRTWGRDRASAQFQ